MCSVGALYLWSGDRIRKGTHGGVEGALGELISEEHIGVFL